MFTFIETYFFWIDLAVACGVTAFAVVFCRGTDHRRWIGRCFWLGAALGLILEVPVFLSAMLSDAPLISFIHEPPVPTWIILSAHTLWDGGLFLVGLALIWLLAPKPVLTRFSWREVAIFVAWGQLSAVAVEIGGVTNDAWVYAGNKAWNPVLFRVADRPIVLLPILFWLVAPIVYYLLVIRFLPPFGKRQPRGTGRQIEKP